MEALMMLIEIKNLKKTSNFLFKNGFYEASHKINMSITLLETALKERLYDDFKKEYDVS